MMVRPVSGFSKKSKEEKIAWLVENYLDNSNKAKQILQSYWNTDTALQRLHDDFIENTITNYYLPFGVAPNFLIDDILFTLPMVTEESSVVAAASNAAKFWLDKGGFKTEVIATQKNGQVHINFYGNSADLERFFTKIKSLLIQSIESIQSNMKNRGGGLVDIILIDSTQKLQGYYQLHCTFETLDAMGANFINSCLEAIASSFEKQAQHFAAFQKKQIFPEVVMSILSNYVPNCLVRAAVSCPVAVLEHPNIDGQSFAEKFVRAIEIAKVERHRAVTHNKGIMNGVDALIVATGNDFRAVEAGVHAYASKDEAYSSLTKASIKDGIFKFWIEIPLAIGTVGGLTALHPMVKIAFDILQKPNAEQLMRFVAVAGLAQNFAAVRSLVTTGIQKGHMKMHLMNILNGIGVSASEKEEAVLHFKDHSVSHSAVANFIAQLRS